MVAPIRRIDRSADFDAVVRMYPAAPEFFETRWFEDPETTARRQLARLKDELHRARQIPFYARLWDVAGFEPSDVKSLTDLPLIPTYTVDDIRESIERCPPMGDYQAVKPIDAAEQPLRVYFSGGTTGRSRPTLYTYWDRLVAANLTARSYYLAGLRPGDVVLNSWAVGTHNAGAQADEALYWWLGALPITVGTGQTTPTIRQVELAAEYGAASILTIGDYLLRMGEVAIDAGYDLRKDFSFRCFPAPSGGVRAEVEALWGVPLYDSYGFHEVGYVATECPARGGLHVYEDAFIVEIVDPDTGELLPDGDPGNIVVTCLYKTGTAQIRYNSLDLTRLLPRGQCACGSWMRKIDYFGGRSDTMVKLRGTNVWPEAAGRIVTQDARVTTEYFVTATRTSGRDELEISVESQAAESERSSIEHDLQATLRAKLGVQLSVSVVAVGALAEQVGTNGKPKRFADLRTR